jgi:16S rRNA G966 N2-methylase RsmD
MTRGADKGYPGGKGGAGVFQTIINHMPPHATYIEAFCGSGAVLRAKRPAAHNVAIDRDAIALAAVVATIVGIDDDRRRIALAEHLRCSTVIAGDDVGDNAWEFVCGDCQAWLQERMLTGDTLVYADPPYLRSVRTSGKLMYEYELAEDHEHAALLTQLRGLPCMVMISGYWSQMYADMLADWQTVTYQTTTLGGTVATEWLWMNYPLPTALHDYRYLGTDYRERERIKRKVTRWQRRLADMPRLERQALLMALQGGIDEQTD